MLHLCILMEKSNLYIIAYKYTSMNNFVILYLKFEKYNIKIQKITRLT